jgi:cellobiose phosphorylase
VPHQLFSSSAVIDPMISGMLGLDGDALEAALTVRPHIPQDWTVQFDNYRLGQSNVSGTITRSRDETRISLSISGH